MGLVFGMDEAGYGPNLGPLVITVTAWEVPGPPNEFNFWDALTSIVARPDQSRTSEECILIGDSKAVYTPAKGLETLEESVLTILSGLDCEPKNFHELHQFLSSSPSSIASIEPWYEAERVIPESAPPNEALTTKWSETCKQAGITLLGIRSDVVLTKRYNEAVELYDSKGLALSRMSLQLLRQLWQPDEEQTALIIADKHGGRNRYDQLLSEVVDGHFIFRLEESTPLSRYRIHRTDLCFQTKGEAHFPVAVASMVSKYLRELAMNCFNRYWQSHLPDLKPTKGYPTDARRFRKEIAEMQKQLGIPDEMLWRSR